MALGKQIRLHRERLGLTLEQLSERSGVDVGTISALENRDSSKSKYATAIARGLDMTLDELELDNPLLIGSSQVPSRVTRRATELVSLSDHPDLKQVPRVKFKLSAGVSGFAIEPEEGNGKPIFFRKDWFELNGYRPEKLFAVRICGASMEPALWEGDLVVINTADNLPRDGEAFAINYGLFGKSCGN